MRLFRIGLAVTFAAVHAHIASAEDLSALSIEELMDYEVVATPQFSGRVADLPASVSIITEHDIRTYGWRTLADILRSLRGFNITYDRIYSYAGVRGLSPPGDFKPRLQVLIDGANITENIYGSALLGGEFPLDLDLIQRIEVVRGPSASVFGGDAMGGVINIITRSGAARQGIDAALSGGSGRSYGERLTASGVSAGGVGYVVSASGFDSDGERLRFPEMAPLGGSTTTATDSEYRRQLFAKLNYEGWQASLIHGRRSKQVPTGVYGTLFDDPAHHEDDTETLADLSHEQALNATDRLTLRLYSGQYEYEGVFPYENDFYYRNRDQAWGRWWGAESRWQSRHWEGHLLTVGADYRDNYRQDQRNEDLGFGCVGIGEGPCFDDHSASEHWSLYAQDDFELLARTRLTLGLRFDHTESNDAEWSPRLGIVRQTAAAGTFKLLYASAFREPSVFERKYQLPGYPTGNAQLNSEHIESVEGSWEYALNPRTQFLISVYQYRATDIILPGADGMYRNSADLYGRGVELEINHRAESGLALRASYAAQFPEVDDERPANAPQHLLKFNLSRPLYTEAWRLGVESQTTSERIADTGNTLGGFTVVNLNLAYRPPQWPWDLELGIYNVFDRRYMDPIAPDQYMDPQVVRDGIEQDGRCFRLKAVWHF